MAHAHLHLSRAHQISSSQVLLDLNAERADGTLSLRTYSFSKDGTLFAYGLSDGGSDWMTIKVKDVATGEWVVARA